MLAPSPSRKREKDGVEDEEDEDDPEAGEAAWPATRKLIAGWYKSATVDVGQVVVAMMLRLYHDETQGTVLATADGRAVAIFPSAASTTLWPAVKVRFR